jgi:hypothetical protein
MTIWHLAAEVLAAAYVLAATLSLPRFWRGQVPLNVPSWWLWSPRIYPAWLRSAPVLIASGWPFLIATPFAIGLVTSEDLIPTIVLFASVALVLVCLILAVSIALVNRPAFLVPPSLRSQRGMVRGSRD